MGKGVGCNQGGIGYDKTRGENPVIRLMGLCMSIIKEMQWGSERSVPSKKSEVEGTGDRIKGW